MNTTTMSISVDKETREEIEYIAKRLKISRSDVIRNYVQQAKNERIIRRASRLVRQTFEDNKVTNWDELEAFLT
jgi:metal-responsive CopG/Arc/MetJ family transcriptional regulator